MIAPSASDIQQGVGRCCASCRNGRSVSPSCPTATAAPVHAQSQRNEEAEQLVAPQCRPVRPRSLLAAPSTLTPYWVRVLRLIRIGMYTTPPSTGAPSADHRFIRMAVASVTAASEKPRPSGSPGSGTQDPTVPSSATVQRTTPRPEVRTLAAASGGKTIGIDVGLAFSSQIGALTVRSAALSGGDSRTGTSTHSGASPGARARTAGMTRNFGIRLIAAWPKP